MISVEDQPPNALPAHKCTVIDPDLVKLLTDYKVHRHREIFMSGRLHSGT